MARLSIWCYCQSLLWNSEETCSSQNKAVFEEYFRSSRNFEIASNYFQDGKKQTTIQGKILLSGENISIRQEEEANDPLDRGLTLAQNYLK